MADKQPSRRNAPALALHVPEPPFRPGDTPDFSTIKVPAAGDAPRPDVSVEAEETFPLCTHLVRVLDEQGKAIGPWDPKLDPDTLRKMLKDMKTVRVFDDRMYRAQRRSRSPPPPRWIRRTCTSRPIASRGCWCRAATL